MSTKGNHRDEEDEEEKRSRQDLIKNDILQDSLFVIFVGKYTLDWWINEETKGLALCV